MRLAIQMAAIARDPGDPAALATLDAEPLTHAIIRTTCVATLMEAGHASNALPQQARATVNCRLLPGERPEDVQATLARAIDDPGVAVSMIREAHSGVVSDPTPLDPVILGAIERQTAGMWPGVPVVPFMSTGATDGIFYRNAGIPVYGVSGLFVDIEDNRAHGRDERMKVASFYEGQEFLYRLVRELATVPRP